MTFDEYLSQASHCEGGKPVSRKDAWSISRIQFARQVWHDARESAKEVSHEKASNAQS